MTTLPQVARAMREILTTTADEAARTTRFVQRTSPLSGATFRQTLVCGFLGHPQATLEERTPTAATVGGESSPHALAHRFTASAAAWLEQVRWTASARGRTAEPVTLPLLQRLTAVSGQESSTIVLPDVFAAQWHGGGGSTASGPSAALKLQARLEMCPGRLDVPLQEGRAAARAAVLPGPLPAGAVRLAAWGDWRLGALAARAPHEVCWWSRRQRQPAVSDTPGDRRGLLELVEAPPPDTMALAVTWGESPRLASRLRAVRVPQDVADARRRRFQKAARDTGHQVRACRLALAAWTLFVPTVPTERWTLQEALVLGRRRWQIARLFTRWKRPGRVEASRSTTPWRLLGAVYAKLLALLVQHGVFLGSWGASPDRRLTQAAQPVQQHALPLASAFARGKRLAEALLTVTRCLTAGCRMHRRKKPPNTYQLFLGATGP